MPIDIYATNSVCIECSMAIENSGGLVFEDTRGGRYGRWLGVVWW